MVKVGNILVMAGVVAVLAWGAKGRTERAAAARVDAVGTYHLTSQQAKVYDECVDALEQKRLKNGGSNEAFCGCFAHTAADDDDGVKYSVGILKDTVEGYLTDKDHGLRARSVSNDQHYLHMVIKTAMAGRACVKDQQHIFVSNEENATWCKARPDRAADDRCRPRQF